MNETEAKIEKFKVDAEMMHDAAVAASRVLEVIEALYFIDADLLDFLAVEVSREQVERASSERG